MEHGLEGRLPVPFRDCPPSPGHQHNGHGFADGDSSEAERAVKNMVEIFVQKGTEKVVGGW